MKMINLTLSLLFLCHSLLPSTAATSFDCSKLLEAIDDNHLEFIKNQISSNTLSPDCLNQALFRVAQWSNRKDKTAKHLEIIELLLSKPGIDINYQGDRGMTPLMWAAFYENNEIVQQLLNVGNINFNIKNESNKTALDIAKESKNSQIINLISDKEKGRQQLSQKPLPTKPHPSAKKDNEPKKTAPQPKAKKTAKKTTANSDDDSDDELLKQFAQTPEAKNKAKALEKKQEKETLKQSLQPLAKQKNELDLLLAIQDNDNEQCLEILKNPRLNINYEHQESELTPLLSATRNNLIDVVSKLLDNKDILINHRVKNGWTALMIAAFYGYKEIAQLLLENNPELDCLSNPGSDKRFNNNGTAIAFASQQGHLDVVKLLLDHKANPNIISSKGLTPLLLAVNRNDANIVKLLLENNANANYQNNIVDNSTALINATFNANTDIVKLLLNHDANLNLRDKDGNTALAIAKTKNHSEIVKLLENKQKELELKSDVAQSSATPKTKEEPKKNTPQPKAKKTAKKKHSNSDDDSDDELLKQFTQTPEAKNKAKSLAKKK